MSIFKRKKEEEVVDTRSELEKKFEEKGQIIGRKTGTIVQKSVDKLSGVKEKLEQDGTMDKLRNLSDKVDDSIDKVVDKVTKKTKQFTSKEQKDKKPEVKNEDDLYYK